MAAARDGAEDMPAEGSREERAPVLQWIGYGLAPLAFALHLEAAYVMVPWTCGGGSLLLFHLVGLASIIAAAIGTWAAWVTWRCAGRVEPGQGGGSLPRTRFMGATGVGTSAILTVILTAQWIAGFLISTCQ